MDIGPDTFIDEALVRRLVAAQFPQWSRLSVWPVGRAGWDNRSFHVGDHLVARLPSAEPYALQVQKEQRWLPVLAKQLPLLIPTPLALGQPADGYPWHWSIYQWIEGEPLTRERRGDVRDFALALAQFLVELQRIESKDGPPAGSHSFHRGGSLRVYDTETRRAIAILKDRVDVKRITEIWETAVSTSWERAPVWIHGDISAGNLLLNDGQLSAVIDFGNAAVGDPACDLAIAWTIFTSADRQAFREGLVLDAQTWDRGRGWALWKALIIMAGLTEANPLDIQVSPPGGVINEILSDHQQRTCRPG